MFKKTYLIDEPSLNAIQRKETNAKVKIGFAGSIDRTQDINQILEASLIDILQKYQDKVEIEFMGAKPNLVEKYHLKHIPYEDGYKRYTEIVKDANWDIGLAPMPDTEFHSCKYFNKYVEYASFGIAGIYSNHEPYIHGIRNEENGLLAENTTQAWTEAISRLIEDRKLREKISANCIKEANTIYSLETLSYDYLKKISDGYINKERETIKGLWKYKIKCFYARVLYKIKEQGWKLPFWMVFKLWKIVTGRNNKNNTLVNLTDVTKGL